MKLINWVQGVFKSFNFLVFIKCSYVPVCVYLISMWIFITELPEEVRLMNRTFDRLLGEDIDIYWPVISQSRGLYPLFD